MVQYCSPTATQIKYWVETQPLKHAATACINPHTLSFYYYFFFYIMQSAPTPHKASCPQHRNPPLL